MKPEDKSVTERRVPHENISLMLLRFSAGNRIQNVLSRDWGEGEVAVSCLVGVECQSYRMGGLWESVATTVCMGLMCTYCSAHLETGREVNCFFAKI